MLTTAPLEYAVRRALGGRRTLREMAARTWVIEPESTQVVPKAVYLEETLSRVTAAAPFSTLQSQHEIIAGGTMKHLPIAGLQIKGAALVGGSIYVRGHRMALAPESGFRLRDLMDGARVPSAVLGCSYFGNMFFGHFCTEDVPLMQLGRELAPPIRTARPLTGHQRELLDVLGLSPRLTSCLVMDELIIFEDAAQTKSKERRYREARAALAARYARSDPPRGVFLYRGSSGTARKLDNEDEVAEALERRGFVCLRPERMTLAELAGAALGARMVVGVEGSALVHGLYTLAEGGSILALTPPMRFGNIIKNYTDCLGMKYGFVVGEPSPAGFKVNLDEVFRVIERLERDHTS
jgi:capsular polysaccharide biosynthesis protein